MPSFFEDALMGGAEGAAAGGVFGAAAGGLYSGLSGGRRPSDALFGGGTSAGLDGAIRGGLNDLRPRRWNPNIPDSQYEPRQAQFIDQLYAEAMGQGGPSVAEKMLGRATDQNIANSAGMAAAAMRGSSPALAGRVAAGNSARIAQEAARDAAQLRAGEQINARGLLADSLGAFRGQDLTEELGVEGMRTSLANTRQSQAPAFIGMGLNAAGAAASALGLSDERAKTNVTPGETLAAQFLDALDAKGFQYSDPGAAGAGEGQRMGVMAQDLESAGPVGQGLVVDTPQGKMVDGPGAATTALGAAASLHSRLERIEDALYGGGGPGPMPTPGRLSAGPSRGAQRGPQSLANTDRPDALVGPPADRYTGVSGSDGSMTYSRSGVAGAADRTKRIGQMLLDRLFSVSVGPDENARRVSRGTPYVGGGPNTHNYADEVR